jgi:hypothetical protein
MGRRTDIIYVTASIRLRTTAEGGRSTPIASGYRPNHVFEPFSNPKFIRAWMGEIRFSDVPLIFPGEPHLVEVLFVKFNMIERFMQVGRKWWIHEGPKLIGEGEIISIEDCDQA